MFICKKDIDMLKEKLIHDLKDMNEEKVGFARELERTQRMLRERRQGDSLKSEDQLKSGLFENEALTYQVSPS